MGNDQIKKRKIQDKEMQEGKRDCQAITEMKEQEINEEPERDPEYIELEKQNLPQLYNHKKQIDKGQYRIVGEQFNNELPKLSIFTNPEIHQDIRKEQQQKQIQQVVKVASHNQEEKEKKEIPSLKITKAFIIEEVPSPSIKKFIKKQLHFSEPIQQQNEPKQPQYKVAQDNHSFDIVEHFSATLKSPTILLDPTSKIASQNASYWQNNKLILSQPINGRSKAVFRVLNLKYCVGMGMALKEVIQKHDFNYKSYENELSHGLFLVTSQGYSWSHVYKAEDDCWREGFKKMKNNDCIEVIYNNDTIDFVFKQGSFSLSVPESVQKKYTLCFCAYLHEKTDSISLEGACKQQQEQK